MYRRLFLCSTLLAGTAKALEQTVLDPLVKYSPQDWEPELLERAKQANSDRRIADFLDRVDLSPPLSRLETVRETDFLLGLQSERTGNQQLLKVLRHQDQHPVNWMLQTCLGDGVHKEDRQTITQACKAIEPFLLAAKYRFMRARPSKVDSRLRPYLEVPGHPSYPSGHAAQGFVCAELLAKAHSSRANHCREAGISMGLGREVAGLHYPSDTSAGRYMAEMFLLQYKS